MTELLVLNVAKRLTQAVTVDGSRVRTVVSDLDEASAACAPHERGNVRVRSTPNRTRRTPKSFDTHALLAAPAWVIAHIR
jgi:hypothetical protein